MGVHRPVRRPGAGHRARPFALLPRRWRPAARLQGARGGPGQRRGRRRPPGGDPGPAPGRGADAAGHHPYPDQPHPAGRDRGAHRRHRRAGRAGRRRYPRGVDRADRQGPGRQGGEQGQGEPAGPGTTRRMTVTSPSRPRDFLTGIGFLGRGLAVYARNPGLVLLGMLPALIAFVLLVAAFGTELYFLGPLSRWFTPFAAHWSSGAQELMHGRPQVAVVLASLVLMII